MKLVSIEKIDDWGGSAIPGNPFDGDLVRYTYDNGAIKEKIYKEKQEDKKTVLEVKTNKDAILNDGIDSVKVSLTIKDKNGDVDENGDEYIILSGGVGVYDVVLVTFANGKADFDYTTTQHGALVSVLGGTGDMFYVYRDLS